MRAIDLALKDLRQLVRDWKAATFLVAMPVIFTLMFGFAFGGFGGAQDPRLPVGFLDRDGSALSASLRELLAGSDAIRPVVLEGDRDTAEVEKQVQEKAWAAAVIVPGGYGEGLLNGQLPTLEVIVDPNSSAGQTAQGEIQAAAGRLVGAVEAAQLSTRVYAERAGFTEATAQRTFLEEALGRAIRAWEDPPLKVSDSGAAKEETSTAANAFGHSSPSMIVQFSIAGVMGAGEIIVLERKGRVLARLLTTAISRAEIILGHFLAMLAMILVQLVLLIGFAQLALRVDYLREPLAVLLVVLTTALFTASLGLLIGTLAKSDEQVIIFTLVLMFLLAGLGGAWMPLEFTSPAFQTVGHLLPSAWVMDGFENLVTRGLGLQSVLLPAGILLAYAVVVCGLAVWRFKFE
jgi:ABC-2 type transport system permease protein